MSFILPLLPGEAATKAAERYFDKEIVRMDKAKRKAIIAGNWKMNKTATEAAKLVDELIPAVKDASCEVVICTPYTDLVTAVEKTKGTNIHVGAENVHFEKSGAFTGEISADMLVDLGVEYVIVGHSERRKYHPEDDANIVDQVRAVLAAGMQPILCVGESFEERRQGIELDFAVGQVRDVTRDLNEEQAAKLIVAYEPVWAIGTGMVATPQSAQDAANAIRNDLKTTFGTKVSDSVRILYGGSVTSKNAAELISQPDVDGFLIGGAALDVEELAKIARLALKSTKSRN